MKQFDLDTFNQLVDELIDSKTLIVVEGKNDKKALKKLGFDNIITLSTPLYQIVEIVATYPKQEVAILTDFDAKGKELYKKIKSDCSQRGIRIKTKLRSFLRRETDLVHIEGLDTFVKRRS